MPLRLPTRAGDVELVVAAGLLEAAGHLNDQLTTQFATERLRELLSSPAALWWSGYASPASLEASLRQRTARAPRWLAPDAALLDRLSGKVLAAWRDALPPGRHGWGTPVLRIEVSDAEAAQYLAALGEVDQYLIAPHVARQRAYEFSWRWPMRIGIAGGPRSEQWRRDLERSHYKSLFDVHDVAPDSTEPVDIVFVDADAASMVHAATCVIVLGASTSPAERLLQGREAGLEAPIVIGAASSDVKWFEDAIREMAHDQPIDVALRVASPDALIAADPQWLPFTAVRQWSLALAEQLREEAAGGAVLRGRSPEQRLHALGTEAAFDSEQGGAARTTDEVRALDRQGFETVLRSRKPEAAMSAPEAGAEAPERPAEALPARNLIADAWANGHALRKALLPDADHALHVRVAVPRKGETAAGETFPEESLPAGESVELMVDVTNKALGLQMRRSIVLSTSDRSQPSTTAVFPFRTQGEGSVVDFKILVTHQERPLQEAHYVAVVRNQAVSGDRARLNVVPLSSSPEPVADATPAQVSLEVNGANLERSDSKDAIDLSQVRQLLETIELEASRVLASEDAPAALAGDATEKLLVKLARAGAALGKYLEPLGIGDARTISLLVDASSSVLPLELVYDAPVPKVGATLCEHRHGGTMVGNPEVCANAGATVVCPYAFWGQRRVIARTIRLRGKPARRTATAPLKLSPVLYAAATRADAGAPEDQKPSDLLQAELRGMVGADALERVNDWGNWELRVQQQRPQLLVVLGHTESAGLETLIEIGTDSWLRSLDINATYLHDDTSPPPLVVLLACSTGVARDCFGGLPAAFASSGAAAVVATLTKLQGPHGARAAAAVVRALCGGAAGPARLGASMTHARRQLVADGLLVGLFLVSHGEIDLPLQT
jgi:hypothetical protein